MADDFKVSTTPSKPGDQPVAGKGGFLPVYGTKKVQDMRARNLNRMAMEKAMNEDGKPASKPAAVSRSMSKR